MKLSQLKKAEPTIESIRLGALEVSVEAQSLLTPSLESLAIHRPNVQLLRKLDDLVDDLSSFVSRKISGLRAAPKPLDLDRLFRTVNKDDYLTLAGAEVPVPEGMSVKWLVYLSTLKHANGIAMRLYDDTLQPFSLFIGQAINDPSKIANSSFHHGAVIHDLTDVTKALLQTKGAGKRSAAIYSEVVDRNSDWQQIEDEMNAILKDREKVPQELVRKVVLELDNQIKLLIKRMGDTNLQYRPSPEVITQLADICHTLAEQVSYYAVVATLVTEAKAALEATHDELRKA